MVAVFGRGINPIQAKRVRPLAVSMRWSTPWIRSFAQAISETLSDLPIFFPHVAHHAQIGIRVHAELVAHLSVGEATRKSAQYDCFFAGQNWVQPESRSTLDADYFGFLLHGVT
jgi:hypothetical protein